MKLTKLLHKISPEEQEKLLIKSFETYLYHQRISVLSVLFVIIGFFGYPILGLIISGACILTGVILYVSILVVYDDLQKYVMRLRK